MQTARFRSMNDELRWFHPPNTKKTPLIWIFFAYLVTTIVSFLSKLWMDILNKPVLYNREQFLSLIEQRPNRKGLVTVSNHYSCLDDPCIWSIRRWKHIIGTKYLRWIPTAHDICFTNNISSLFFSLGKCVPVIRGNGVYQKGTNFCLEKLNRGDWIHVFPEGKVNAEHNRMRLKWGVGRLIAECDIPPIVLPMYHMGLDDVLPNRSPYIPQIRKNVTIIIGDPVDYTDDLKKMQNLNKTPIEQRKYIIDDIQAKLFELRKTAEQLHQNRLTSKAE